jgi:hypothetical protein
LFAASALGAAATKSTAVAASTIASFFIDTPKMILTLREDSQSFANGRDRVNGQRFIVRCETGD